MIDWRALVLNPSWLERLDRLAVRRFGAGGLAEEASAYVLERLSDDNWGAMASFKGQAKPETFLHTLAANMLEEFSRDRFGRPRPPEWLKRQGESWIQLWRLICLERQDTETVVARHSAGDMRDPTAVRQTIRTIKARIPNCGLSNREVSAGTLTRDDDPDARVEEFIADPHTPDGLLANHAYDDVVLMLTHLFEAAPADADIQGLSADFRHKFAAVRDHLRLSEQEILLLRMVYQDGHKRNNIAASLGLASHQPGRIIANALQNIRAALEKSGIDLASVYEAMN